MLDRALLPLADDRVRLRPLLSEDAVAFAQGTLDPAVKRYAHLPEPVYTPATVRTVIERDVVPGLARGDLAVLAIADAGSDAFAGSLVLFDVGEQKAEIGFWLHPEHRGRGFTVAAVDLAARFARASHLSTLTARTLPENAASQRVLEHTGFVLEGERADVTPSGRRVELLHYARALEVTALADEQRARGSGGAEQRG